MEDGQSQQRASASPIPEIRLPGVQEFAAEADSHGSSRPVQRVGRHQFPLDGENILAEAPLLDFRPLRKQAFYNDFEVDPAFLLELPRSNPVQLHVLLVG
jgi:hypothetical protein